MGVLLAPSPGSGPVRVEEKEAGDRLSLFSELRRYPRRLFPPDGRFRYPQTLTVPIADQAPGPVAVRVRTLAEETLEGTGLFVVDVVVRGAEGRRVVEVFVDGPGGAGIDELTEASRRLSFLLDAEDAVPGSYRLDVSSPGADRPLSDPRQYPRHVGRTLRVSYMADAADPGEEVTLTGVLQAADEAGISLQVPGRPDGVFVDHTSIRDARVVLPW